MGSGTIAADRIRRAEELGRNHAQVLENGGQATLAVAHQLRCRIVAVLRGHPGDPFGSRPSVHDRKGVVRAKFGDEHYGWWSRVGIDEKGLLHGDPPALYAGFPSMDEARAYLRAAGVQAAIDARWCR